MTCDQAMPLVEKLADGEATPRERADAEAHLDGCEECRAHYQFVRALESAAEKMDWPEPPEAYWQHLPAKVLGRLDAEPEQRSLWQVLFTPAVLRFGAVAATLTVVVAVGISVMRDNPAQLEPQIVRAPEEGRQPLADDKAAVVADAEEPAAESEAPAAAPPPLSRSVGVASAPTASDRPRPESVPPDAQLIRAAPGEPTPGDAELELDELERTWDASASNAAGLEDNVVVLSEAEPPAGKESRLRTYVESAEAPGEAGRREVPERPRRSNSTSTPDAVSEQALGTAASQRSMQAAGCAEWRAYLERNGDDGSSSREARYRVAVCSLEEYEARPSDERRTSALADMDAFLALERDSERAEEIRRRVTELRR